MLRLDSLAAALLPRRYELPAKYWYRRLRGRLDPELAALVDLARGRSRAIDVGANYGLYSYAFSRVFRQVEAFEPLADSARVIDACGASNVTVHQVALSSTPGTRTLYLPQIRDKWDAGRASFGKPAHPARTIPTTVRRLDEYNFRDVSAIKIDVEGHELAVLQGAADTLARERPVLLVEIEQRHLSAPMTEVFEHLEAEGFGGCFLEGNQLQPVETFAYEKHQEPWLLDTDDPRYINNFLFIPR